MATNITVFPVENDCVIYLQDGSSYVIKPQETHSFQLIDNGFCTISETTASSGEPSAPPPEFVQKMYEFWKEAFENLFGPQATPV